MLGEIGKAKSLVFSKSSKFFFFLFNVKANTTYAKECLKDKESFHHLHTINNSRLY